MPSDDEAEALVLGLATAATHGSALCLAQRYLAEARAAGRREGIEEAIAELPYGTDAGAAVRALLSRHCCDLRNRGHRAGCPESEETSDAE